MGFSKQVVVLLGVLALAGCTANKPLLGGSIEAKPSVDQSVTDDQIKMYIYPSSGNGGSQGYFLEFDVEPSTQETVRYRG